MGVVLRLLLLIALLPAHAPACKACAVAHTERAPSTATKPCCAKCRSKAAEQPAPSAPKPDEPAKPDCPPNCPCPLCAAPAALVPDVGSFEAPLPLSAERLPAALVLAEPDGAPASLDRPPRA